MLIVNIPYPGELWVKTENRPNQHKMAATALNREQNILPTYFTTRIVTTWLSTQDVHKMSLKCLECHTLTAYVNLKRDRANGGFVLQVRVKSSIIWLVFINQGKQRPGITRPSLAFECSISWAQNLLWRAETVRNWIQQYLMRTPNFRGLLKQYRGSVCAPRSLQCC